MKRGTKNSKKKKTLFFVNEKQVNNQLRKIHN
jgi:hypothetical protein